MPGCVGNAVLSFTGVLEDWLRQSEVWSISIIDALNGTVERWSCSACLWFVVKNESTSGTVEDSENVIFKQKQLVCVKSKAWLQARSLHCGTQILQPSFPPTLGSSRSCSLWAGRAACPAGSACQRSNAFAGECTYVNREKRMGLSVVAQ